MILMIERHIQKYCILFKVRYHLHQALALTLRNVAMLTLIHGVMECSHWQTLTQTPTLTKWVCNPFASVSLSVSVLESVSTSVNISAY